MFPVGRSLDDGSFASNESIVVLKSDGNNENNDVQDIDGKLTTEQIVDDNYISHYGDFVATLNYTYNYEKDRDYYTVAMKFVPNEAYADNYEASDTFSGNLVVNQGVAWDPYINVSNYLKVYFDANGNKEAINGISTTVSGEYAEIAGNLAATGIDSRFEDNVYLFRKSNNNIQLVDYSSTVYLMASNAGTHKVWCYLNPNFAYSGDTNYIEENSDNVSIDENNTILYQWEMAKYELELGSWCFKNDADGTYNLELNSDGKVFVSFYGTTDEHVFLNGLDFNFEVLSESETDTYLTATGSIAIRTDGNEEGNKRRQVITIDSYEPVFAPRDSITVVVRVSFAGNADIAAFDEECQLYNIKVADVPDAIKNFESEDSGFLIEQRISGYNPIIYTLKPTETFETFMEALDAYKTANNLAGTFKVYCYKQGQNSYEEMTLNDYGTQTRDDLVNGDIYNHFKIEYIGKNTASDEFTFEFKSGKDITGKMFEFRDVVLMHADGTAPTDADSTFISMTQGIKADNLTQSGDSTVGTTAICEYAETLNSFGKVSGTFTINGATFDQLIQDEGPYHYYYDVRGEETTVSIFTYDEYNNQDVENRLVGNFVGDTLTLTMKVPGSNNELIWEFTFKLTGSLPDVND